MVTVLSAHRARKTARLENVPGLCPASYRWSENLWDMLCCQKPAGHTELEHDDPHAGPWAVVTP